MTGLNSQHTERFSGTQSFIFDDGLLAGIDGEEASHFDQTDEFGLSVSFVFGLPEQNTPMHAGSVDCGPFTNTCLTCCPCNNPGSGSCYPPSQPQSCECGQVPGPSQPQTCTCGPPASNLPGCTNFGCF